MVADTEVKKAPPTFTQVQELRPDTHGHNLKLKVLEAQEVSVRNKSSGGTTKISECLVGDSTGCIVLIARNEQVTCHVVDVVKPGKYIIVRNSKIEMYKGSMRLGVTQWGKVEEATEDLKIEPKNDNNLSLIEFELVPVSEQSEQPSEAQNGNISQ